MNWGKECTSSVHICCIRIMICLLKTPFHLKALCFNHEYQKNNSSESRSEASGKTLHFFENSVLEVQEVSPGTTLKNNVFISFLRVKVLGRRKEEKNPYSWKITNNLLWTCPSPFYFLKKVLPVKIDKKQYNLLEYLSAMTLLPIEIFQPEDTKRRPSSPTAQQHRCLKRVK